MVEELKIIVEEFAEELNIIVEEFAEELNIIVEEFAVSQQPAEISKYKSLFIFKWSLFRVTDKPFQKSSNKWRFCLKCKCPNLV